MNTNKADTTLALLDALIAAVPCEAYAAFLEVSLTEKERQMLSERWRIFAALRDKHPQREISSQLECGIATVTRGAQVYRNHEALINRILDVWHPPHS